MFGERGMIKRHTDREYEAELQRVRDNLLAMAGLVEQMIADAVRALLEKEPELARTTMAVDHQVNRLEVETDELCLLILAKRQPVASDLRFITLAMKMVTDLERIGDLAVNICERALALAQSGPLPSGIATQITRMSTAAQTMVRDAIDAFIGGDVNKAQEVWDSDGQVDELYITVARELQRTMRGESDFVERGLHLQAVAKFLERMGDHGTNLAELVIFMIKGKDIRHLGSLDE
jgi:phosphate transport system protein